MPYIHTYIFTLAQNQHPVAHTVMASSRNGLGDTELDDLVEQLAAKFGALEMNTRTGFPTFTWWCDGNEMGGG